MKLTGREALRFCTSPDPARIGVLIHGEDAGQIASARQQIVRSVLGDDGDDMRLTRMDASDARKDAASVEAALKTRGFFPGRQVLVIEGGTDGLAAPLTVALADVSAEDAFLVVTAGVLPARSKLRKFFEDHRDLVGLQLFLDAPEPADIDAMVRKAGAAGGIEADAVNALVGISAGMDHGSFAQLIEIIGIYYHGSSTPVDQETVLALAPVGLDTEMDAFVGAVASGQPGSIGPLVRRLSASGAAPVGLLLALQRHFRQLLQASSASGGPESGLAALRPPVWGPRRSAMSAQLRRWGQGRLEQANRVLFETDGKVRSSGQVPDLALVERCALRLAIMGSR